MSLKALYQQFLAKANPTSLAEGASLNYITTLTTVNEPTFILKHLAKEEKQVKKKEEKVLDAIEAEDAVFLEVETTMEFLTSGGAYLPGLDDNFLADRTVTFPIVRPVSVETFQYSPYSLLILVRRMLFTSTPIAKSSQSVLAGIRGLFSNWSML